jgi:hypothetical protein
MHNPMIGECAKHPGHNFVNCTLCKIAEFQANSPKITFTKEQTKELRKSLKKIFKKNPHIFRKPK